MKISFCTAIKNRLEHIKQTLPKNIEDNKSYPDVQFVVLDYNSEDGLEAWVKNNLGKHIESGRLVFYRTNEPIYFHRSHSRNIAFKLSDGDIICNVDADNFTGKEFANYIYNEFFERNMVYLWACPRTDHPFTDNLGRIACRKTDFLLVDGFDEDFEEYGYEDYDLVNKLDLLGVTRVCITNELYLKAIFHDNESRIKEERTYKTIRDIFIRHISPSKSDILILFKQGRYRIGRIIDLRTLNAGRFKNCWNRMGKDNRLVLENGFWEEGFYLEDERCSKIRDLDNKFCNWKIFDDGIKIRNRKFYKVVDRDLSMYILMLHSEFINKKTLEQKRKERKPKNMIGHGVVFKNFETIKITV